MVTVSNLRGYRWFEDFWLYQAKLWLYRDARERRKIMRHHTFASVMPHVEFE